jgi:hypothetical protein
MRLQVSDAARTSNALHSGWVLMLMLGEWSGEWVGELDVLEEGDEVWAWGKAGVVEGIVRN